MWHPIWLTALRLADENGRLRIEKVRLLERLAKVTVELRSATRERDEARRDADLLALMAKDRKVALEFVRTRHDVVNLDELKEAEA